MTLERQDPYRPPKSEVLDTDDRKGSPAKAVTVGVLIDIGGSSIAGFVMVAIYGVMLASSGASPDEIAAALGTIAPDSWFSIIGFGLGALFSLWGGYVCARIARQSELKWGGVVAAISASFSLLIGMAAYSILLNLAAAALTIGAVMFGAWTGAGMNRRQA